MGAGVFEASSSEQMEAVAGLLQRAFGVEAGASLLDRDYLRWKYYDDWPERRGSRSMILSDGGEILAHAAIWPVRLRLRDGGVREGISFGDWVAGEQHRGMGLSLLKKLMKLTSFVVVTGGAPITRAILPRAGFAPWGERQIYARVVRPVRQALTRGDRKGWKEPLRVARNAAWSMGSRAPLRGWSAEESAVSDELLRAAGERVGTVHSPGYLEYMLRCPTVRFRLLALRREGELKGYGMLGFAGGQARLAELRVDSGEQGDWDAAVAAVAAVASEERTTCEISAIGSVEQLDQALLANGFRGRGRTPVVVYDREGGMAKEPLPQLGMLEDDAASLYEPGFVYRT